MNAFLTPMQQLGEFEEISQRLAGNRGMLQVTGCIDSQKPHFIYCAGEQLRRMKLIGKRFATVIIAHNDLRAKEIFENFKARL